MGGNESAAVRFDGKTWNSFEELRTRLEGISPFVEASLGQSYSHDAMG